VRGSQRVTSQKICSKTLKTSWCTVEHLLVALLHQESGLARSVLDKTGVAFSVRNKSKLKVEP
jgi:hypothetical protein